MLGDGSPSRRRDTSRQKALSTLGGGAVHCDVGRVDVKMQIIRTIPS